MHEQSQPGIKQIQLVTTTACGKILPPDCRTAKYPAFPHPGLIVLIGSSVLNLRNLADYFCSATGLHLRHLEQTMDPISISAASGMRARMESLELLANNLANVETGGYKADREFYSLYTSAEAGGAANGEVATLPVIESHWTDLRQGDLKNTGNPLDLALDG